MHPMPYLPFTSVSRRTERSCPGKGPAAGELNKIQPPTATARYAPSIPVRALDSCSRGRLAVWLQAYTLCRIYTKSSSLLFELLVEDSIHSLYSSGKQRPFINAKPRLFGQPSFSVVGGKILSEVFPPFV